jgi:uncharacterized protein (UPF0305 family)
MAVLSFDKTDADTVFLRNAVLRMILSRAQKHLAEAADLEDLEVSKAIGAISFYLLDDDQRARLVEAVYQGTQDLKQEVAQGKATEEPVRAGIEEKLDEILALLSRFRREDRETHSR